jgi:hypothetical protein
MTGLDILLAVAGFTATLLVVAGMILLTPRGSSDAFDRETDRQGEALSSAESLHPTDRVARHSN